MIDFFVAHEIVDVHDERVDGEELDRVALITGVRFRIELLLDEISWRWKKKVVKAVAEATEADATILGDVLSASQQAQHQDADGHQQDRDVCPTSLHN